MYRERNILCVGGQRQSCLGFRPLIVSIFSLSLSPRLYSVWIWIVFFSQFTFRHWATLISFPRIPSLSLPPRSVLFSNLFFSGLRLFHSIFLPHSRLLGPPDTPLTLTLVNLLETVTFPKWFVWSTSPLRYISLHISLASRSASIPVSAYCGKQSFQHQR